METQRLETRSSIPLPDVDKSLFVNMSPDDKEDYVKSITITYPKMQQVFDVFEDCKKSWQTSGQDCASVLGPSRAGKTIMAEQFKLRYPDYDEPEGVVKPVLFTSVPCPAHIGPLIAKILYDMKDPFWAKRYPNLGIMTIRLYELLNACKVQLIIIDETQQLVDRDSKKLIKESADWFKDLINITKIPVVFMGLPESSKIFIENEQLGGRVLLRETVEPFPYDDKGFRSFLHVFDGQLPFENSSGLAQPDISQRIYLATDGFVGFVNALLARATNVAAHHKLDSINIPVLAHAYNAKLAHRGPNPFLSGFDLDKAMEKLKR